MARDRSKNSHPISICRACVAGAQDRDAQVLTDFAVDAYGFTRMLIRSKALPRFEAGRLAQRVLEIETI